jgi:hypothetical protein
VSLSFLAHAASQRRPDTRGQHARAERLGDVVVRAQFEPGDDIGVLALGRSMTTGIDAVSISRFNCLHTYEKPSTPGSIRSRIIKSGCCFSLTSAPLRGG